ncbi:hypothetical protein EOPP23_05825 [Endozoicomonas sp. OPT23]|uniref:DUF2971 domain-containing protein n=1 Tax=Endozoicomonas sp. OPT23 TaxID=2072845 RepID=UPI00129BA4DF|nr:DUF2971 domain-containing protein [Endozoicomonas sp. OPT23]MRI32503.1 hypothetical protein [Endozoicomonas sp. OPT23]
MDEKDVIYRYKYLPFDTGSLEVIKSGTIKFTNPLMFNDPFDCFPHYDQNAIDEIPSRRKDLLRAASRIRNLSPAQHIQNKRRIVSDFKRRVLDKSVPNSILEKIGVLSLSRDPRNILMWSHYADFHKGFVVEFRIPTKLPDNTIGTIDEWLFPLKVNYSKERPVFRFGLDDSETVMNNVLLTKYDVWKYEQEERVVDNDRGPGIHSYLRNNVLSSVIAGAKMSQESVRELSSVLDSVKNEIENDVKLYVAEQSERDYEILIPDFPRSSVTET